MVNIIIIQKDLGIDLKFVWETEMGFCIVLPLALHSPITAFMAVDLLTVCGVGYLRIEVLLEGRMYA